MKERIICIILKTKIYNDILLDDIFLNYCAQNLEELTCCASTGNMFVMRISFIFSIPVLCDGIQYSESRHLIIFFAVYEAYCSSNNDPNSM